MARATAIFYPVVGFDVPGTFPELVQHALIVFAVKRFFRPRLDENVKVLLPLLGLTVCVECIKHAFDLRPRDQTHIKSTCFSHRSQRNSAKC